MTKLPKALITLLIPLLFIRCNHSITEQTEGVIEYDITYPKMDKDNFMLDFMPRKMQFSFKDNTYSNSFSAGMGMFKSNFVCNKNDKEFIQMIKLINKKYALKLNGNEILTSTSSKPSYTIEFTSEIKNIIGYNCNKAIVSVNNEQHDAFTVYYTDKINIETPNWCNEFAAIPGVMLEYQYEKYGVCMHFSAKKIEFKNVNNDEFTLTSDYNVISEPEMEKEMQEIFDSFK